MLMNHTSMKPLKLLFISSREIDLSKVGHCPSVLFYGTDKLAKDPAFELTFSTAYSPVMQWLWKPFSKYIKHRVQLGFRLDQAVSHILKSKKYDVIFAANDSSGLPLLLLKKMNLIHSRIVFNSAGLINNLERQKGTLLYKFFTWILTEADPVLCWSPLEQELFQSPMKVKATFIPLEPDTTFHKPSPSIPTEDFILCVGNDIGRDFKTVLAAAKHLGLPFHIVTKADRLVGLEIPENVTLHLNFMSYPELLSLYARARLVIVNAQEIHRFSGQRALLEALALGKATIAAEIRALTSTYQLTHGDQLTFYKPGSPESLAKQITRLYDQLDRIKRLEIAARDFAEAYPKDAYYQKLRLILLS